jgi:spermidine/putrescine transport system permease protein
MKRVPLPLWAVAIALYLFIYAPIAVVVIFSFNDAPHGGPWNGFTLRWYQRLLDHPEKIAAVKNTFILAGTSTLIATVLGAMLGYGLSRYWFPGKKLFSWLMYIPVVIPDIVMAVALMLFYALVRDWTTLLFERMGTDWPGLFSLGMMTMVIAHVTFQIPFVAIVVRARLVGMDPAIEEAAHDLGANTWQTFCRVTLPLMLPGVLAGAMLAFTLSLDDFVVSFFTTGPGATTLPILIYSSVRRGITPEINALSTLIIVASVIATIGVLLLQRPRKPTTAGG